MTNISNDSTNSTNQNKLLDHKGVFLHLPEIMVKETCKSVES